MIKVGRRQTSQLNDVNWGVLDHPSRAPQLTTVHIYVHAHMLYM